MVNNEDRIQELAEQIRYHSQKYFNHQPEITDAEFDALVAEMKKLDPSNEVLLEVGAAPEGENLVKHPSIMGSLEKVHSPAEIEKWASPFGTKTVRAPKIDGCYVRIVYDKGNLVQAASRGNGEIGQDRTMQVKAIKDVPKSLDGFTGELRGEIYMKKSVFESLKAYLTKQLGREPRNARNTASGTMSLDDAAEIARRGLSFICYDVSTPEKTFKTEMERMAWVNERFGGKIEYVALELVEDFAKDCAEWEKVKRQQLDYDIDGLVLSVNDLDVQEDAGWKGRCPNGKVAFKFQPEKAETPTNKIEPQVGRTGRLTPMARLKPVLISGSLVSNATLHNYGYVRTSGICAGDIVVVEKAGEIIPQVVAISKKASVQSNSIPSKCPSCDSDVVWDAGGVNLWCVNPTCKAQFVRRVMHFLKTLEIKEVGESAVESLHNAGLLVSICDLYRLDEKSMVKVEGIGSGKASIITGNINAKKQVTLAKFLDALGIDGLGTTTSKDIAKKFKTLDAVLLCSEDAFKSVDGIGEITSRNIVSGLKVMRPIIDELRKLMDIEDVKEINGVFSGKSFVLTGSFSVKKAVLEGHIIKAGGEVRGSVAKGVTYLVQAEATSTSAKSEKAKKLGVSILSEQMLMDMLKG